MDEKRQSSVTFLDSHTQRRVRALEHAVVTCSSHSLGWSGVQVETASNGPWEGSGLVTPDHYLCFNRKAEPISIETKVAAGFRRVTLPPGGFWTCSAGDTFTHQVREPTSYGIVTLAPALMARAMGAERVELIRSYGVEDERLRTLFEALVTEARFGGDSGATFVDGIVTAMAACLMRKLAVPSRPIGSRRRLELGGLQRVLGLIEDRLAAGPTQAEMATCAGLSPYHFAREFRRLTGKSPHQYVLQRRLERAHEKLKRGHDTVAVVALAVGFADQSHLSRHFKRHFGVPPSAVLGRRRKE